MRRGKPAAAGATVRRRRLKGEADARRKVALYNRIAPPVRDRIVAVLRRESSLSNRAAEEAAFHLTDWIVELRSLAALFRKSRWGHAHAMEVIRDFVVHAPWHLNAAHRILLDDPVTDPFDLGAVKGTGRPLRKPGAPYRDQP